MDTLKTRRLFVSGLFHETNTFIQAYTELAQFHRRRGDELFSSRGNGSPVDGLLQAAEEYGWEVVPGVHYEAAPSGPLRDEILEEFWKDLRPRLEEALAEGIDAIFLILHGAMATENFPDAEGEILERIRKIPGADDLPLFAVLDLHANVSARMARNATALIPYRENPHTDARETAVRAARHLRKLWAEHLELRTYILHSGLLLAPPSTGTVDKPMSSLQKLARSLEKSAGHLEIGVVPGFAHADTPDTGMTLLVVSDKPELSCIRSLENLLQTARHEVRQLKPSEWQLTEAIHQIEKNGQFPALLVEPADNIGGGTPGDATFVLRALLGSKLKKAGVIINDPAAVEVLRGISPGESATISLGGKGSSFDFGPVTLEATLVRITDGKFTLEDKQSHLASMAGCHIEMGPCAVVTSGNLTILITSTATPPFDLGQWLSQGIDPSDFEAIGVKAAVGHRRAYDPIAKASYTVKTPGPGTSDLHSLPYRKIRRPIYPLDAL
jgi:microcystin degradation protein MlrC